MTLGGRAWFLLLGVPVLAAVAGCRRGPTPVAELRSDSAATTLAYPELVDVGWSFTPLVESPPGEPLTLFVHLLDEPGSVLRTFDRPLGASWRRGRSEAIDLRLYQSALAEPLPPGDYLLTAGLYARGAGADGGELRFPLRAPGPEVAHDEYRVMSVHVPVPGTEMPRFRYSANWLPAEPGTDRQVLARRWLRAGQPGALEIGSLAAPALIWLRLEIPAATAEHRLETLDSGAVPSVSLRADCGGFESVATGIGAHEVEIAVPGSGPQQCHLEVTPNFRSLGWPGEEDRSVVLTVLAWGRRGG